MILIDGKKEAASLRLKLKEEVIEGEDLKTLLAESKMPA